MYVRTLRLCSCPGLGGHCLPPISDPRTWESVSASSQRQLAAAPLVQSASVWWREGRKAGRKEGRQEGKKEGGMEGKGQKGRGGLITVHP